jgi:hypothetical protein
MNSRFTLVVRFFSLVVAGFSICISSQPAQASNPQTGRLIVQRSPTFGGRTYLQLWIDGKKVANIGRDTATMNRFRQDIMFWP